MLAMGFEHTVHGSLLCMGLQTGQGANADP